MKASELYRVLYALVAAIEANDALYMQIENDPAFEAAQDALSAGADDNQ